MSIRRLFCLWILAELFLVAGLAATLRIGPPINLPIALPSFFNGNEGWGVSRLSVLRTVDGGKTWKEVKVAIGGKEANIQIGGTYFVSAKSAWLTLEQSGTLRDQLGLPSRLISTRDGGETWRPESLPNVEWFFDSLWATDDSQGPVWLGGQTSQTASLPGDALECPQRVTGFVWAPIIYFRPNPGSAWEPQKVPVQNGCPVSIMHFLDKQTGIATVGTAILFSDDGGRHWQESKVRAAEKIHPPISVQFRGREGWIGCSYGEILHTVDGGKNWEQTVKSGAIWSKARGLSPWGKAQFISKEIGFDLGGDGELFGTSDQGETWNKVALPQRIQDFSCAESSCWLVSKDKLYRLDSE
jgi:photosystem II stability/assembly factor-like uncharacterized protein